MTSEITGTPSGGMRRGPIVPYMPGLDGLRALAVIAVIVYHADKRWLAGGFLGVEVFFVISGYLITLLLLAERERTGTVSLTQFWKRRARRLLPALWTLLVGLVMYVAFFDDEKLGMLRGDVIASFLYVANWFQVWTGSSYTDNFAFAPLRHLWSLAVEEQFYILWPLIMYVLLRWMRTRRLPILGLFFLVSSVAITVWTAIFYQPGVIDTIESTPEQYFQLFGRDVLRTDFLYLGTISRASGLFLGAALATMWRPWSLVRGKVTNTGYAFDIAGALAIGALAVMCWRFSGVIENIEGGPRSYDLLYQGGLFLVGLATVVVIASVTRPRSVLGRYVIGNPLFVWIGLRSYGLYLYHWPIFQIYREYAGVPLQPQEFLLLMALTLVITELSYRFIETPLRKGGIGKLVVLWRSPTSFERRAQRRRIAAGMVATAILPVFAIVTMSTAKVVPDDITQSLDENEDAIVNVLPTFDPSAITTVPGATQQSTTTVPANQIEMLALGDSVMLGAAQTLTSQGLTVDAQKSRQFLEALPILNYLKSVNELGNEVVLHLGTNGPVSEETLDAIMVPLADVERVVILTTHVPDRGWETPNNKLIRRLPERYPNVIIVDWKRMGDEHPEYFAGDKTHLNKPGVDAYVKEIIMALGRELKTVDTVSSSGVK
jgi:peptidoglycan/LPS O-acetylase OafA/YrhL